MSADYKTLLGLVREFLEQDAEPYMYNHTELLERARAAVAPKPPAAMPEPGPLNFHVSISSCCRAGFCKALRENPALPSPWLCPKCGTEWHAEMVGESRNWTPVVPVMVFKR